jgi:hypothetical protein
MSCQLSAIPWSTMMCGWAGPAVRLSAFAEPSLPLLLPLVRLAFTQWLPPSTASTRSKPSCRACRRRTPSWPLSLGDRQSAPRPPTTSRVCILHRTAPPSARICSRTGMQRRARPSLTCWNDTASRRMRTCGTRCEAAGRVQSSFSTYFRVHTSTPGSLESVLKRAL